MITLGNICCQCQCTVELTLVETSGPLVCFGLQHSDRQTLAQCSFSLHFLQMSSAFGLALLYSLLVVVTASTCIASVNSNPVAMSCTFPTLSASTLATLFTICTRGLLQELLWGWKEVCWWTGSLGSSLVFLGTLPVAQLVSRIHQGS